MKISTKIFKSINYGLSNKKDGIWGSLLLLYTFMWAIWSILFTFVIVLAAIDTMIEDGLITGLIVLILFLTIFVILPYLLIYYAWSKDQTYLEKQNISSEYKKNNNLNNLQKTPKINIPSQKTIKNIDMILHGEKIVNSIQGTFDNKLFATNTVINGSVFLTSSYIVFYSKKIFGGYHSRDFQISDMSSITFSPGWLTAKIIFHMGSINIRINTPSKSGIAEKFVEDVKSIISTPKNNQSNSTDNLNSNIFITRETEFYQGYIRLKMSITNPSSLVVNDVALDFDYDDKLLRMDIENQKYAIKNGKIILGNISSNSSTSVEVYFDPMMCSKGTDINCQVNYKDAKGQLQTSWMKPKKISVVCPIMETESDINIGRLKEFIEKLTCQDSKVYQIQNDFNIDVLKNTSREVIEKHDMKHIRTFSTKDGKMCEIWYYGKTKINNFDIVIKITISIETQSIELFAATQTKESLVGLLAEFGRELKNSIESNVTGNVKQIINVSIIDSIVQRSNLLSYCDFDGNCSGDVVIDGSYVQRSNINNNLELNLENKEGVNKMDMLDVYKYLVSIVEKSSNVEDIKIDYKDVWTHFNQDVKIMLPLFNMLNQICNKCRDENKPLLSAIVINEDNGIPGPGFFKHCIKYLDTYDELKTKKIHENELERVFNYWNKDKK